MMEETEEMKLADSQLEMVAGGSGQEDITEQITQIIAERLSGKSQFALLGSSTLKELGADSLEVVDIVKSIEDQFRIRIPAEELGDLQTVEDIIRRAKQQGSL